MELAIDVASHLHWLLSGLATGPQVIWVGGIAVAALWALWRLTRSALRHMEATVVDALRHTLDERDQRIACTLTEHRQQLVRVVERAVARFEETARIHHGTLPEGFPAVPIPEGNLDLDEKLHLWAHRTAETLGAWLADHPREARAWRLTNPDGFRLWAARLTPGALRRIWPEDFSAA